MSAQRYIPTSDQRYAPPDDSRFTPRDRSPPRYGADRFSGSASTYRGGYQGRSDNARETGASSLNREPPRGPRGSFDTPRGRGSFSTPAPRGRGFPPRGDYRGGFRGGDSIRTARDSDSWPEDPDRSWRDRQFEARDRRTSPAARARQPEFRDFRETANPPLQRETDFNRPRGPSREPSYASTTANDSRRESFSHSGRPYFGAARGRPDWDSRTRDRDRYSDERSARNRSRSPYRDLRRDHDATRGRNDGDARDDRRYDGRDRSLERDDRDRSYDRYGRPRSPTGNDIFKPSPSSTSPSTPRPNSPGSGQVDSTTRALNDADRDASNVRRVSASNLAAERWEERRGSFRQGSYPPRAELSKDLRDSRASSPPPQAPEVPAFGSLPFAPVTNWNVWKNPNETKPAQQTAPPLSVPTGPKANTVIESKPKPGVNTQPPTAPKAERAAAGYAIRSDTRDQSLVTPRSPSNLSSPSLAQGSVLPPKSSAQSNVANSPPSPTLNTPSGPRTSPAFASSQKLENVPTGPRADRIPRGPSSTITASSWQWQRPTASAQADKSGLVTPAKRDFNGDERWHEQAESRAQRINRSASNNLEPGRNFEPRSPQFDRTKPLRSPASLKSSDTFASERPTNEYPNDQNQNNTINDVDPSQNMSSKGVPEEYFHEDSMELDEDDFEKQERKFQREKSRLESELIDLSSRHLRASTPLEQLAILQSIALFQVPSGDALHPSSKEESLFGTGQLLTPKAEATDGESFSVLDSFPQHEPPPVESPELEALPYLHQGPPTPFEDLEFYKLNIDSYRVLQDKLTGVLEQKYDGKISNENILRAKYARIYLRWITRVEQLDSETKDESPPEEEVDPSTAMPPLEPTPSITNTTEGRRRGGNTEYDLERVLAESLETANREQARRTRQETSAKFDYEKEAEGKPLEEVYERERHHFVDKNSEISPTQALSSWNLRPPVDKFTETDHELLVQKFWEYPKKWGKLAQELDHRYTYKDCINHYYATKWDKEFKEKRDKRKQKRVSKLRAQGISGRPKANALISNLGDNPTELYEGDEFGRQNIAMTDRGRPRRAAAPTFGEKETDDQNQPTVTPARRGPKVAEAQDDSTERSGRRNRTVLKEKPGRKSRGQPSLRARSSSPEKIDYAHGRRVVVEESELVEGQGRDAEFVSADATRDITTGTSSRRAYQTQSGVTPDVLPNSTPQAQRSGPSSYWSVQEVSAFPTYLELYGSDWQAIAMKMGTKTQTMVKNYYFRLLNQNNGSGQPELTEIVEKADQRRQRDGAVLAAKTTNSSKVKTRPVSAGVTQDRRGIELEVDRSDHPLQENIRRKAGPQDSPYGSPRDSTSSNFRSDFEHELAGQPMRPSEATSYPAPLGQPHPLRPDGPRNAFEFEGQRRTPPQAFPEHVRARHVSDVPLPSIQPAPGPATPRYHPGSPPQQSTRVAVSSASSRAVLADARLSGEERQYRTSLDQQSRPLAGAQGFAPAQPTGPPSSWLSGVKSSSPFRDYSRAGTNLTQQPSQTVGPKTEPRKVSNIAAILNADDEPRRPSHTSATNQMSQMKTITPPIQQSFTQRPSSTGDRYQQYSEPSEVAASRGVPTFSRQSSLNSPASATGNVPTELQLSSHAISRTGWQSPPNFPSYQQTQSSHPLSSHAYDRRPAGSPPPTSEYNRQPLQGVASRHPAPTSPPLGPPYTNVSPHISQASLYRQSLQESHRSRPLSPPYSDRGFGPAHSSIRSHYANQDPNGPQMRRQQQQQQQQPQNYSAYQSNNNNSHNSDGRAYQRDSGDASGRPKIIDPDSRYGSRFQREDGPAPQERETQVRSNLRPDSFLIHGSGNYRSSSSGNTSQQPFGRHSRQQNDSDRRANEHGSNQGQSHQGYSGRAN